MYFNDGADTIMVGTKITPLLKIISYLKEDEAKLIKYLIKQASL
jgi:hypothetical protein